MEGGLARLKSAPVSWFDSFLLEQQTDDVDEIQIPLAHTSQSQSQCAADSASQLPNHLRNSTSVYGDPTHTASLFTRHNSSPPQLLANLLTSPSHHGDGDGDGVGVASNYDILSFLDIPPTTRESDPTQQFQLKGEQSGSFCDMEMEKLFQDSVPCRVRAKRGCATHPRSIAERVRRTRISDRIRKLQELVPNMDKQTNTADMLEEAVEYVKFLQKQIQELSEHQKNCKCLGRD